MAGAFVDGALKGFEMMERHQARKDDKARLSIMDERNEERYRESIERQNRMDEESRKNRESDVTWRESQAESTNNYRNDALTANKEQTKWQQNYKNQQAQWQKDQQAIPVAWQSFRETGQVPEELSDVLERNKGMDPRTYMNPQYRAEVKGLGEKLDNVIKSGNMAEANSPETLNLFNNVFKDKISQSVGQFDEKVNSKIASVDFAGFVPAEREDGSVALALKVTYANGSQEIKPMTKGRSSDGDDPVMTYTPKELVNTIKTRAMMADMMERPEYWDKMGAEVAANFGRGTKASAGKGGDNGYQKQLNSIQDEMTKALAKIEGGSDLDYLDDGGREEAKNRVKKLYQERIEQLQQSYGTSSSSKPTNSNQTNESVKYISKIDGVDAKGVISKFMEANKNLSEQQATQIAIQQGYLSNDQ
ncbi:hypothetical protein PTRA_a1477 [Pseudoalteromonas translucida KMM 520]|uniref:Uncharacterized protein n=1 Tax=Pseudoalteromonas translucida KMM 520 TaxID=1315283 RepID=A0A0U2X5T5_9GAMM|nr:hypothetical protein [Pseudoalteromonas translucida]ALS32686.1 hypothetical protein PTRA_a1477 [Pseudoalteromonas translucida KMM 520]